MIDVKNEKYGLSPEEIEKKKKSLSGERFKTIFNMHRIEITKLLPDTLMGLIVAGIKFGEWPKWNIWPGFNLANKKNC